MADTTVYGALPVEGLTLERTAEYLADTTRGHTHDGADSALVWFGDIDGVNLAGVADGNVIVWNQAAGEFQPAAAAPPGPHDLNSHTDVTITAVSTGHFLRWSGTAWVNVPLDASYVTQGNLDWARLPAGSGTWIANPTISGAFTVTGALTAASVNIGGGGFFDEFVELDANIGIRNTRSFRVGRQTGALAGDDAFLDFGFSVPNDRWTITQFVNAAGVLKPIHIAASGGGGSDIVVATSGAVSMAQTLTVTGDINASSDVVVSGKISLAKELFFSAPTTPTGATSIYAPAGNTIAFRTNSTERARLTSAGSWMVGTSTAATGNPTFDLVSPDSAITAVWADNTANLASKQFRFGLRHFTNIEEAIAVLVPQSDDGTTAYLNIGGGTGSMNAMTGVRIWTAANSTTLVGTLAASWNSAGTLTQAGDAIFSGTLTADSDFTLTGRTANSMLVVGLAGLIETIALGTTGQFLAGVTSGAPGFRAIGSSDLSGAFTGITGVGTLASLNVSGSGTFGSTLTVSANQSNLSLFLTNTGTGGREWRFISSLGTDTLAGGLGIYDDTANAYRISVDPSGRTRFYLAEDVDLSGVTGAVIIGGDGTGQHIAIDGNEIMSKATATTAGTLFLQASGGTVSVGGALSISGLTTITRAQFTTALHLITPNAGEQSPNLQFTARDGVGTAVNRYMRSDASGNLIMLDGVGVQKQVFSNAGGLTLQSTLSGTAATFSGDFTLTGRTANNLLVVGLAGLIEEITNGTTGQFLRATTAGAPGFVTIQETDIADGAVLARLAATETVSGAWTFSGLTTFSNAVTRFSNGGAAIFMDTGDIRRITNNDGGGNWNFRSGHQFITSAERYINTGDGAAQMTMNTDAQAGVWYARVAATGTAGAAITWAHTLMITTSGVTVDNGTVWHSGNDGAGSTLDADLLDAQQGAYYLDLANATGTLGTARGGMGINTTGSATGQILYWDNSGGVWTFLPPGANGEFLSILGGVPDWTTVTVSEHVLATTTGLGGQHTVSGLTAGQVLRATGATTAAFQALTAADIGAGTFKAGNFTFAGNLIFDSNRTIDLRTPTAGTGQTQINYYTNVGGAGDTYWHQVARNSSFAGQGNDMVFYFRESGGAFTEWLRFDYDVSTITFSKTLNGITAAHVAAATFKTQVSATPYAMTSNTTRTGLHNSSAIFRVGWTDSWIFTVDDDGAITAGTDSQFSGSGAGLTGIPNGGLVGPLTTTVAAGNGGLSVSGSGVGTRTVTPVYGGSGGDWGTAVTLARSDHTHSGAFVVTNPSSGGQTITGTTIAAAALTLNSPAATAVTTTQDSPRFTWRGHWWNTTLSSSEDLEFWSYVDVTSTTGAGTWYLVANGNNAIAIDQTGKISFPGSMIGSISVTSATSWTTAGWWRGLLNGNVIASAFSANTGHYFGIGGSDTRLYFFHTTALDTSAAVTYWLSYDGSGGNIEGRKPLRMIDQPIYLRNDTNYGILYDSSTAETRVVGSAGFNWYRSDGTPRVIMRQTGVVLQPATNRGLHLGTTSVRWDQINGWTLNLGATGAGVITINGVGVLREQYGTNGTAYSGSVATSTYGTNEQDIINEIAGIVTWLQNVVDYHGFGNVV